MTILLLGAMVMGQINPVADEAIKKRIVKHRTAQTTLTVLDPRGKPLPNAAVTVHQVRHKFLFGCNAYMLGGYRALALERAYRKRFSGLLNFATLPFYWGGYEPREGRTDKKRLREMARWCASKSIRTKGHPLCWHTEVPAWLARKKPDDVGELQWGRITREVKGFAGLIDTWDAVNEAVIMPDFRSPNPVSAMCKRMGRVELIQRAFAAARKANPGATLLLNDCDTSPRYEKLIRDCLAAGVKIDVIGIQSHMHRRYWGARKAWDVCERFARFRRPLHFTELTILSGKLKTDDDWHGRHKGWDTTPDGEKRQARQVEELYRVLFSHPAVEAITWWDFSDGGAWLGAPAGLVRKDMSPKAAYDALTRLVKNEWWTGELRLTSDADGRVTFRGIPRRLRARVQSRPRHVHPRPVRQAARDSTYRTGKGDIEMSSPLTGCRAAPR